MNFNEQLNKYISQINCSSKELSDSSGLSSTVISRYRNGERTPNIRSMQLNSLVDGLYKLALNKQVKITRDEMYKALSTSLNDIHIDLKQLSKNFNDLVTTLNISMAELARKIGYDSSYISRLRTGGLIPAKPQLFIDSVCSFIVTKYTSESDLKAVALLIGCQAEKLSNQSTYYELLKHWFSTNVTPSPDYINDFLNKLDEFDLEQYIKAIHFDEIKVPFVPFYKSSSKSYYGIEEMKKGEIDFFKATVLSKSMDSVFMCSDMPMEDMAQDVDFGKKWMFAIAVTLKKGLHLNIIHNLDRPFNEMMLGLESWIPIYMTGQVSPYFLKGPSSNVYCHLNYVSGSVALTGECIKGSHDKGKYYLTSNNKELIYYKEKANLLLKKANPLMEIYKEDNKSAFKAFLINDSEIILDRKRIFSSLPLFTISDELLIKILNDNNISQDDADIIIKYKKEEEKNMTSILTNSTITDVIYKPTMEEFLNDSITLSTENIFYDKNIKYTYDDFIRHFELTIKYSNINKNYKVITSSYKIFKNINITMVGNHHVILSKSANPIIHFVIKHPKLVDAIVNFNPLVIE